MNPIVLKFRRLLNEFKRPYIERTNSIEGSTVQDLVKLEDVFQNIDQLYFILKPVIQAGASKESLTSVKPEVLAVLNVFEKEGLFPALRADPSLKEEMERYLTLDLHMYPYTMSPHHINALERAAVNSHQGEIVPNTEVE